MAGQCQEQSEGEEGGGLELGGERQADAGIGVPPGDGVNHAEELRQRDEQGQRGGR